MRSRVMDRFCISWLKMILQMIQGDGDGVSPFMATARQMIPRSASGGLKGFGWFGFTFTFTFTCFGRMVGMGYLDVWSGNWSQITK